MTDENSCHVWLDVLFLYITSGIYVCAFLKVFKFFWYFWSSIFITVIIVNRSKTNVANGGLPLNNKLLSRRRMSNHISGFFVEILIKITENLEHICVCGPESGRTFSNHTWERLLFDVPCLISFIVPFYVFNNILLSYSSYRSTLHSWRALHNN